MGHQIQQAKILQAALRRTADFRGDPAARAAYDLAVRAAQQQFSMEMDGSDAQADFITSKMAHLIAHCGPELHVRGLNSGYRGRSKTLDSPQDNAYRERKAKEFTRQQTEASAAARGARQQGWLGQRVDVAPDARPEQSSPTRVRYGSPSKFPSKRYPWHDD
jgi:hypothetical protein